MPLKMSKKLSISTLPEEQLAYNEFITNEAHALGLSVGLKNDLNQLENLVDFYGWALNDQCFEFNECDRYSVFTDQDKAVFGIEYSSCFPCYCLKTGASVMGTIHVLDRGVLAISFSFVMIVIFCMY
jgi:Glycoside-hydrolase family GH114